MTEEKNALVKAKGKGIDAIINYYFATKTPNAFIKVRPGAGGQSFRYVTIGYVISQLNIAFNFNWEWKIIEVNVGAKQVWLRGELTIKDFATGNSVTRSGVGGSVIKTNKEGQVISIGNDIKAADSDALKVAAAKFGIGADIKFKEMDVLEQMEDEVDTKDDGMAGILMRKMFALAKQKGVDEEQINQVIKKLFNLEHKRELTNGQLQELIKRLEAKEDIILEEVDLEKADSQFNLLGEKMTKEESEIQRRISKDKDTWKAY